MTEQSILYLIPYNHLSHLCLAFSEEEFEEHDWSKIRFQYHELCIIIRHIVQYYEPKNGDIFAITANESSIATSLKFAWSNDSIFLLDYDWLSCGILPNIEDFEIGPMKYHARFWKESMPYMKYYRICNHYRQQCIDHLSFLPMFGIYTTFYIHNSVKEHVLIIMTEKIERHHSSFYMA